MNQPFAIVQFTTASDLEPRLGFLCGDRVHDPAGVFPWRRALDLLGDWEQAAARLRSFDLGTLPVVGDAELAAPLTYPSKIFCAGANYYSQAAEMNAARPDPDLPPFFFLKPPTSTVVGPSAEIAVRDLDADRVDWEAELAVVIGTRCSNVPPERTMSVVAGYLVSNDLSARGRFARPGAVFPAFGWDWVAQKSLDGFCPIGPGIVPSWLIEDPHALRIQLSVNGEMKQDDSTADMVVRIPHLVAEASRISTLEPGDLILTGTPAGIGVAHGDFLADGDEVLVAVEGVGSIRHRIVQRT